MNKEEGERIWEGVRGRRLEGQGLGELFSKIHYFSKRWKLFSKCVCLGMPICKTIKKEAVLTEVKVANSRPHPLGLSLSIKHHQISPLKAGLTIC